MPPSWIDAINSLKKLEGYRTSAQLLRTLIYPALIKELNSLGLDIELEKIEEEKDAIVHAKVENHKIVYYKYDKNSRNLGWKYRKKKKEWKESVPRRAMERSSLIHRRPLR